MGGVTVIDSNEFSSLLQSIANLEALVKNAVEKTEIIDPLMTSQEVQDYLKKGSTWVDANKHKIGCSKVGGEWRFRKSVVDDYVSQSFHRDR